MCQHLRPRLIHNKYSSKSFQARTPRDSKFHGVLRAPIRRSIRVRAGAHFVVSYHSESSALRKWLESERSVTTQKPFTQDMGRRPFSFSRRKLTSITGPNRDMARLPIRFRISAYVHGVMPTSNVCTLNVETNPYASAASPDKQRLPMVFSRQWEPTCA